MNFQHKARYICSTIAITVCLGVAVMYSSPQVVRADCTCCQTGSGGSCVSCAGNCKTYPGCIGDPNANCCPAANPIVVSCGGGNPCAGNTQCGQCGNPACCSVANPAAPTLVSPPDNSDVPSNNVAVTWDNTGSWGVGCPQSYTNYVQLQTACAGAWSTAVTVPNATVIGQMTRTLNSLQWATTYCWRVQKSNGSAAVNSLVRSFKTPTQPWLITHGASTSAGAGYTLGIVNTSLLGIVPGLGSDSYLSSFLAISGNSKLPSSRVSKVNTYATGYADSSLLPPAIAVNNTWYQFLYNMVSLRKTIRTSAATTLSGNINIGLAMAVDATDYVSVTGNLSITADSVCNVKAVVFVTGTLTINPSFTKTTGNGCMFIAKGDITINGGSRAAIKPTIRNQPNIVSVTLYEISQFTFTVTIPIGSNALNKGNTDLVIVTTGENYDVYLSDANGTFNPDGAYISVETTRANAQPDFASGNNIDAVGLNFSVGGAKYATSVPSELRGSSLSPGFDSHWYSAMGAPNNSPTWEGDPLSRLTLGFALVTPSGGVLVGNPPVPAANYDIVQSFLITDGTLHSTADTFSAGQVPDGLDIQGGVVSKAVDLQRSFASTHNGVQPAEVFDYDGSYLTLFRDALAMRKFSLREE